MKLEKLPKEEKNLTDKQKTNLFNSIVLGNDCTEIIETSRGKFKIKYPRMSDIETIGRLQAYKLNGIDSKSFDPNILSLIQKICTLEVLIVDYPAWFKNAKKENGASWSDIPSFDFIEEVYNKVLEFRFNVQQDLEGNKDKTNKPMATNANSPDTDKFGAFDGLNKE